MKILDESVLSLPSPMLAPMLLGKLLCVKHGEEIIKRRITETEAYFGEEDTACHAHHGKTPRTSTLYLEGGHVYVYLCYGIHSLLNIVSGIDGHPEAVLIRGVEGAEGPGRVTKLLGVTREYNALKLGSEAGIWIEDDGFEPCGFETSPRVGIDYAEPQDRDRPWRFTMKKLP